MVRQAFARIARDEEGAVTVDWVVLTAAILVFGALVAASVLSGATRLAANVGTELGTADIP